MKQLETILTNLSISQPAQQIYISLLKDGEATARTLASRTNITRTSIYDHVKLLKSKNLIVERAIDGTTFFAIGDVRQLEQLLGDQIDTLNTQQKFLSQQLPKLIASSQTVQPKIRFFEGADGTKQLLKDILWYDNITLYIYWPYEHMLNFFGEEFLTWFNQRRKVRDITIKTIWNVTTKNIKNHIFSQDSKDVQRRYLTQKKASTMSYIIYDKKVAFISSDKESFGFIVDSQEFATLMHMQFNALWTNAKSTSKK